MATQKSTITFSRRAFMRTSSLAGGGLLIGFNLFNACKPKAEPPVDLSKLNYNDFNAFIEIADNDFYLDDPNHRADYGATCDP